jgi:hypothetical protein
MLDARFPRLNARNTARGFRARPMANMLRLLYLTIQKRPHPLATSNAAISTSPPPNVVS